jgi:hypothetical protein
VSVATHETLASGFNQVSDRLIASEAATAVSDLNSIQSPASNTVVLVLHAVDGILNEVATPPGNLQLGLPSLHNSQPLSAVAVELQSVLGTVGLADEVGVSANIPTSLHLTLPLEAGHGFVNHLPGMPLHITTNVAAQLNDTIENIAGPAEPAMRATSPTANTIGIGFGSSDEGTFSQTSEEALPSAELSFADVGTNALAVNWTNDGPGVSEQVVTEAPFPSVVTTQEAPALAASRLGNQRLQQGESDINPEASAVPVACSHWDAFLVDRVVHQFASLVAGWSEAFCNFLASMGWYPWIAALAAALALHEINRRRQTGLPWALGEPAVADDLIGPFSGER